MSHEGRGSHVTWRARVTCHRRRGSHVTGARRGSHVTWRARVTCHMAGTGAGHMSIRHTISFHFCITSQKIDFIFTNTFQLHRFLSTIYEQIWPAPSVLILSLHPHANPFAALLTPVPRVPAAPATRHSSVAMMSPFQSACSAPLNSHILSFSISASLSHSL